MAVHVVNPVIEAKLRTFARERGVGLTEAIGLAIDEAAEVQAVRESDILEKLSALQDKAASYPDERLKADKAYLDWLMED